MVLIEHKCSEHNAKKEDFIKIKCNRQLHNTTHNKLNRIKAMKCGLKLVKDTQKQKYLFKQIIQ